MYGLPVSQVFRPDLLVSLLIQLLHNDFVVHMDVSTQHFNSFSLCLSSSGLYPPFLSGTHPYDHTLDIGITCMGFFSRRIL